MSPVNSRQPPQVARFRSIDRLGIGGQGEVWLMLDPKIDRRVAMKVLQPSQKGSQATLASFRNNLLVIAKGLSVESAVKARPALRSASSRFRDRPSFDFARDVLVAVLDVRANQPDLKSWTKLGERRAADPSPAGELTGEFESNLRKWIASEDVSDPVRQAVTDFFKGDARD